MCWRFQLVGRGGWGGGLTGPLTLSAVWLLGAALSLFSIASIVADEDVFLQFKALLRIRDVCPGSRILIFTHPGSRISDHGSRIPDLGSRIQKQQQKRGVKRSFVILFM